MMMMVKNKLPVGLKILYKPLCQPVGNCLAIVGNN
jgi:hypothetical protein